MEGADNPRLNRSVRKDLQCSVHPVPVTHSYYRVEESDGDRKVKVHRHNYSYSPFRFPHHNATIVLWSHIYGQVRRPDCSAAIPFYCCSMKVMDEGGDPPQIIQTVQPQNLRRIQKNSILIIRQH